MLRPTLAWIAVLLLPLAAPTQTVVPYGEPGCRSGLVPTLDTGGQPPSLGNSAFGLVAHNLVGATPGVLWVAGRSARLAWLDLVLHVDPTAGFGMPCQAGGLPGVPGAGTAQMPLPIPFVPALAGGRLFFQGFFLDPSQSLPLVHTRGLEATLALASPPEYWLLRDRTRYQAFFAGASAGLAAQLGQILWTANQVAGFRYLRTDLFAAGGESHWLVIVEHLLTRLEFCLIPGGGSAMGDLGGTGVKEELPVHTVVVAPFLLARTEVTQAQFTALLGSAPWKSDPVVLLGPTYAAPCIDFADATRFCQQAGLRLPSEAEWEYACRAGTRTCYSNGENFPPSSLSAYAWYGGQSAPHPVARKLPNAFGLHDMHGNLWEWCQDVYFGHYTCAPTDGSVRWGPHPYRVARGGGWYNEARGCRSPSRGWVDPAMGFNGIGFRPAGPRLP